MAAMDVYMVGHHAYAHTWAFEHSRSLLSCIYRLCSCFTTWNASLGKIKISSSIGVAWPIFKGDHIEGAQEDSNLYNKLIN
jgi:hypothetical protein